MAQPQFSRYAGPFVALGGLVALAGLASTWYINRLQTDLARTVRQDAARLEAAEVLQIYFRQLRFHSLMVAADPGALRQALLDDDRRLVSDALAHARRACDSEGDLQILDTLDGAYADYEAGLASDVASPAAGGLMRWADAHPVRGLLTLCRELADRQRQRMRESLERSESQTTWAGRVLLGFAVAGALGGLLSGYGTARAMTRRAAQLSVRVQAVHARLDQEVGAMTVEPPGRLGDLDEQLDRVVARVREVCERLQDQERELLRAEQLAAVGHLAAGVAHEIRNPLTGIKFLVEAAVRPERPTPLTPEDLGLIRQEIVRIERTVQGLLDFARTPPTVRNRHDLRAVAADAVAVARGRAEAKPVTIRTQLPSDAVPADVDRDQFIAMLTNLLCNAIDATPAGGEVVVAVGDGGRPTVEVTDTGPGIDPKLVDRLFQPFATTKPTGTGLGLTIARRIARDHGGTLTADNRPGGGARFTIQLPAPEATRVQTPGR
jgi:two-component system, NtrC family, sensor histidine kinase HydH